MKYSKRDFAELKSKYPERQHVMEGLESILEAELAEFRNKLDALYEKFGSVEIIGILFFVTQLAEERDIETIFPMLDPMEEMVLREATVEAVQSLGLEESEDG